MNGTNLSRASTLTKLDEFCSRYQLDYREALAQAGLPQDTLTQPDNLIPYSRMAQLLEICARESGNPLFGLEYGAFQGTAVFGRLLYLFKNANTVGGSLSELTHYYHLHSSAAEVATSVEEGMAVLTYEPALEDGVPSRQIVELAIGVGKSLMKMLMGSCWKPSGVHFRHGAGSPAHTYARILGVTPQFNSTSNGWVFDAQLLNLPLSDSDPELHALIREHLEKMDALTVRELPDYVRRLMRSFLPNGQATIELIADYMMLSPRSLQRYLAQENTSFQKLLNETRQSMAERYLKESTISLTQLSGILGYSDLAAFSRAFQRWYGASPRQWRKERGIAARPRLLPPRRRTPAWLT
ncbi:AraC family transcriptional regulator, partial [Marinobacter daepoensis]|uniref:AraC family transcriptional regulator n=1 Tax=Marinobacter daepoensis TaxID=262077 RepID=UPI0004158471